MSHPPKTMSFNSASGTNSLMSGDLPSVRLPRRTVPICVSEPIGLDSPLRIAKTPAIVVVLTAPRPTRSTPSRPLAGSIEIPFISGRNYIIRGRLSQARQMAATVDGDSFAGHPGRARRDEKCDEIGNLVGGPRAAERMRAPGALEE